MMCIAKTRASQKTLSSAHAFTLVELLVSVAIMTVMILAVSAAALQSRRVVSQGQAGIRANQAGAAITRTVRGDLWKLSQLGFLCITQTAPGSPPVLMLTTAGPIQSKTDPYIGLAGISIYGMAYDIMPVPQGGDQHNMLYRQTWVMEKPPGAVNAVTDMWTTQDLGDVQILPRYDSSAMSVDKLVDSLLSAAPPSSNVQGRSIRIPAESWADVQALWQVLAPRCKAISVLWTYADRAYTMDWRGIVYSIAADGSVTYAWQDDPEQKEAWQSRSVDSGYVVYNAGTSAQPVMRALWTNHILNNWPKALKFRFRLVNDDPSLPPERKEVDYEVVCPIGLMG